MTAHALGLPFEVDRKIGIGADDDMMIEFGLDLREEHDAIEFRAVALDVA